MLELVGNLQTALGEHIAALDWMSDATKAKAQEKLASFHVKIGYPDKWKDYSTLTIDPSESYWQNIKAASLWGTLDNLRKFASRSTRTNGSCRRRRSTPTTIPRPTRSASLRPFSSRRSTTRCR